MNFYIKIRTALFAVICIAATAFGDIVFYGATKITVPAETTVDVRNDARFRIFARCDFDGDISHKIVYPQNTVITSAQNLEYSVTNSKGESQSVVVPVVFTGSVIRIERSVYTLYEPDLLQIQVADAFRGDWHDKQHFGIYLSPQSRLRVRFLPNPGFTTVTNSTGPVSLPGGNLLFYMISGNALGDQLSAVDLFLPNIMTGDSTMNLLFRGNIGGTTGGDVAFNPPRGGIPFVNTPRTRTNIRSIVLELEITDGVRSLDYFHYGDDNALFLQKWTQSQNDFALLQTNAASIVASRLDRDNAAREAQLQKADELLEFYDDFISFFNRLHGLEINSDNPRHRLIHTRFFLAPARNRINSGAWAFYSRDLIAMNLPSGIAEDFLRVGAWVTLHEVGHGYDGNMTNRGVNLSEVITNVVLHYWQLARGLSTSIRNNSDLRVINNRRTGNIADFNSGGNLTDFDERLLTLVNIYSCLENGRQNTEVPEKIFSTLQRLNRDLTAQGNNRNFAELNARVLSDVANRNVVPYFDAFGFTTGDLMRSFAFEEDNRIPYFVDILTGNLDLAQKISDDENLHGRVSAIYPNAERGMNGSAEITLNISDFALIEGRRLRIKDGATVVFETALSSNKIEIPSLPMGAYYIQIPPIDRGDKFFLGGYNYLVIKNGQKTETTVEFTRLTENPYENAAAFNTALTQAKEIISAQKWGDIRAYKDIKTLLVFASQFLSAADRQRFENENPELFADYDFDGYDEPDNGTRILSANSGRRAENFTVTGITGAGRLNLSVPVAGNYTVSLYSIDGRQLAQTTANLASGANSLSFNRNLARGITIVKIRGANNAGFVKRIMVR